LTGYLMNSVITLKAVPTLWDWAWSRDRNPICSGVPFLIEFSDPERRSAEYEEQLDGTVWDVSQRQIWDYVSCPWGLSEDKNANDQGIQIRDEINDYDFEHDEKVIHRTAARINIYDFGLANLKAAVLSITEGGERNFVIQIMLSYTLKLYSKIRK
jgi:hypothetical protein